MVDLQTEERGTILYVEPDGFLAVQMDDLPLHADPRLYHPHQLEVCW